MDVTVDESGQDRRSIDLEPLRVPRRLEVRADRYDPVALE
jgi:hypothetical protein